MTRKEKKNENTMVEGSRAVVKSFITSSECEQLLHIQRVYSVPGYTPELSITNFREVWGQPELNLLLFVRGNFVFSDKMLTNEKKLGMLWKKPLKKFVYFMNLQA